eukprot:NODE_203_length_14950_cov_0.414450.p1 type:complete len:647 gc:universal NODE_203_length_14950_cov_0.414450:2304-4244(+)
MRKSRSYNILFIKSYILLDNGSLSHDSSAMSIYRQGHVHLESHISTHVWNPCETKVLSQSIMNSALRSVCIFAIYLISLNIHDTEFPKFPAKRIIFVDYAKLKMLRNLKSPIKDKHCTYPFKNFLTDLDKQLFIQCITRTAKMDVPDASTLEDALYFYKKRYGTTPLHFNTWYKFASERNCRINRYDQLNEQLSQFKKKPNDYRRILSLLPEFFGNDQLTSVDVKNGVASVVLNNKRASAYLPIFERLQKMIPDMNFLINTHAQPVVIGNSYYQKSNALVKFNQNYDEFGSVTLFNKSQYSESSSNVNLFSLLDKNCKVNTYRSSLEQGYGLFINAPTEYQTLTTAPILSWGGYPGCSNDILIPSVFHYDFQKRMRMTYHYPSWGSKYQRLIWRGTTSGTPFPDPLNMQFKPDHICTSHDECGTNQTEITKPEEYGHRAWFYSHRQRAVTISDTYDDMLDLQFVSGVEMSEEAYDEIFKFNTKSNDMAFSLFFNSKFILDIDGNGYSSRFLHLLKGNSLIFSAHYALDWFSDIAIPFYHFIPVNMGFDKIDYHALPVKLRKQLIEKRVENPKFEFKRKDENDVYNSPLGYNDLAPKVLYYQNNLDLSEQLALNGQAFANKYLRNEDMDCYIFRAVIELHDILENET